MRLRGRREPRWGVSRFRETDSGSPEGKRKDRVSDVDRERYVDLKTSGTLDGGTIRSSPVSLPPTRPSDSTIVLLSTTPSFQRLPLASQRTRFRGVDLS